MIRLLETPDAPTLQSLRQFCAGDCLGVRAIGPLLAYGTKYPFVSAWEQVDDAGHRTAFLTRSYGDITVSITEGYPEESLTELQEFLQVIGWSSLTADPVVTGKPRTGYRMKLKTGADCTAKGTSEPVSFVENEDLALFYRLLAQNNPGYFPAPFDEWLVDFSHRIRHGTAQSLILQADGKPAATAAALSMTEEAVFLGAISTNPECRGRHLAQTCILQLTARFADRPVHLMCLPDKRPFYEHMGMRCAGEFSTVLADQEVSHAE